MTDEMIELEDVVSETAGEDIIDLGDLEIECLPKDINFLWNTFLADLFSCR